MNRKPIAIDIETIPDPSCIGLLKDVAPDARLTNPDKIKADIRKKKKKQIDDMGFKPHQNLIICAGWFDGNKSGSFFLPAGGSEKHLLEEYWEHLSGYNMFYTFNGLLFDVPALQIHSVRHKIKPPVKIDLARYRVTNHLDCRAILGNWNPKASGSLDYYVRYFGLGDGKQGMSGDKVKDYYRMGKMGEGVIRDYCADGDCVQTFALAEYLLNYWRF